MMRRSRLRSEYYEVVRLPVSGMYMGFIIQADGKDVPPEETQPFDTEVAAWYALETMVMADEN